MHRQLGTTIVVGAILITQLLGISEAAAASPTGSVPPVPTTRYFPDTLSTGQTMGSGAGRTVDHLESSLGSFILEAFGNRLQLSENFPPRGVGFGPVWSIVSVPTKDQNSFLAVQADGNLVFYSSQGRPLWATNTVGSGTHNRLVVQEDGNIVLRTAENKAVWASYSTHAGLGTNETMKSGQRMAAFEVDNPTRFHTLTMQGDGNLVLRDGSNVLWASNTHVPGSYLTMQGDGNLVLRAPTGRAVWASYTQRFGESVFQVSFSYVTVEAISGIQTPWTMWSQN